MNTIGFDTLARVADHCRFLELKWLPVPLAGECRDIYSRRDGLQIGERPRGVHHGLDVTGERRLHRRRGHVLHARKVERRHLRMQSRGERPLGVDASVGPGPEPVRRQPHRSLSAADVGVDPDLAKLTVIQQQGV